MSPSQMFSSFSLTYVLSLTFSLFLISPANRPPIDISPEYTTLKDTHLALQ
jgi:hypothetical protein